jgi:hypothetical protein
VVTQLQPLLNQIRGDLPDECARVMEQRDGSAQVTVLLQRSFDPRETADGQCAIWDNCARYYTVQGRFHEALSIFSAMYAKLMDMQENRGERLHKGTPLVRISEIHGLMGHPLIAKRYLMLTLCEDAISSKGNIPIDSTGSYFRAAWLHGISDEQFRRYASDAWNASQKDSQAQRFPEWALQELDQKWMTEYPSTTEASFYVANSAYVRWLLSKLGAGDGKALERLAHYLLSCVPGFRARMRMRSKSTDYDVYCAIEGPMYDFRSELGRYFLCESKDWQRPADVTTVQKFAGVLRGAKCEFGIIFSKNGISGRHEVKHAERELLKIKEQGVTILAISENELKEVSTGDNFFAMLRDSYERERLDLPAPHSRNLSKRKKMRSSKRLKD